MQLEKNCPRGYVWFLKKKFTIIFWVVNFVKLHFFFHWFNLENFRKWKKWYKIIVVLVKKKKKFCQERGILNFFDKSRGHGLDRFLHIRKIKKKNSITHHNSFSGLSKKKFFFKCFIFIFNYYSVHIFFFRLLVLSELVFDLNNDFK